MRWDEMRWDEMRWDEMRCDEMWCDVILFMWYDFCCDICCNHPLEWSFVFPEVHEHCLICPVSILSLACLMEFICYQIFNLSQYKLDSVLLLHFQPDTSWRSFIVDLPTRASYQWLDNSLPHPRVVPLLPENLVNHVCWELSGPLILTCRVFDRCRTTGKLVSSTLLSCKRWFLLQIPNQINSAVDANGGDQNVCGAFSMTLRGEVDGCTGNSNQTSCLYVLHTGCSNVSNSTCFSRWFKWCVSGSNQIRNPFFRSQSHVRAVDIHVSWWHVGCRNMMIVLFNRKKNTASTLDGMSVFRFSSLASHAYAASLTYG